MHNAILTLNNVHKSFDQNGQAVQILRGVTATFTQGERVAIVGVSGTGKSTLMHLLSGIDVPSDGTVALNGVSVIRVPQSHRTTSVVTQLGVAFQYPYLIAELSAVENIALAGLVMGHDPEKAHARAVQLLEYVALNDKCDSRARTLSGGQQQRVSLARALYHNPAFLIADEPTGNLDEQTAQTIMSLITSFCTEFGMGVILSTHDRAVARSMDEVYQLHNGVLEKIVM